MPRRLLPLATRELLSGSLGRQVSRGAGAALLIHLSGSGLAYVLEVVLARILGANEYGVYSFVLACIALLVIASTLGLSTSVLRDAGVYAGNNEHGLLKGLVYRSWQIVIIAASFTAIIAAAAVAFFGAPSGIPAQALWLGFVLLPLTAVQELQTSMARGLRRITLAFLPRRVAFPILLLGGLLATLQLGASPDSTWALKVTIAAATATSLAQAALIRRSVFSVAKHVSMEFRTREWLTTSIPMLLIAGFMLLLARTDVLMLGWLASPAEVGVYNAATRTANLTVLSLAAVNAIVAPMIADLWHQGKQDDLQRLASGVAHLVFWPAFLTVIVLLMFGSPILSMFGEGFSTGRLALSILALANLFNVGVGSVGYFMNMTGNHIQMAAIVGAAAILNIVLNLLAIPTYGINGAAIATGIAICFWNFTLYTAVVRRLNIRPSILYALRQVPKR